MCESSHVETREPAPEKPPLGVGRIAGEILAGTAAGLATLVTVYGTLILLYRGTSELDGLAITAMFVCVFPPLHVLASAVGVYLVGNVGSQTGSFLRSLGGGLGAELFMYVLLCGAGVGPRPRGPEEVQGYVLLAVGLLITPIATTWGFNSSRKYKEPPES